MYTHTHTHICTLFKFHLTLS